MIQENIVIAEDQAGKRIEVVCAQLFPLFSRSTWQKHGHFFLDDAEKPGKTKVHAGEKWQVQCLLELSEQKEITPWKFPLKVLAESDSWVVIEKPEGISVHPSSSAPEPKTIVNALVHQFGKTLSENIDEVSGQPISRPGLVHRLDKETSGLLLVAKTNEAHRFFQQHWKEVQKIYYAVVSGIPPSRGRIEAGIQRDEKNRQKMTVGKTAKAKDAVTRFERIETHHETSLLKIIIPTGRTHQIRVHLSEIGFPIVGDQKYGGKKDARMFLHATELSFPDPDQKGNFRCVQSPVPPGFFAHKKEEKY